jgi:hypothetical protein
MEHRKLVSLFAAALILVLLVMPASAVIQEVTLKGTVSAMSQKDNTLTLDNAARYGCTYPADGSPVCSYATPVTGPVKGMVPTGSTYDIFKKDDTAVGTSLGDAGGTWMTLAKLAGPGANEEFVTDLVGDPNGIPTPLVGNYAVSYTTEPDCSTCYGTTCTAVSATVSVTSNGAVAMKKTLLPRQSFTYNARNDGSSVSVSFVKGEAPSLTCASGQYGMTGPQPVSVFVINVVPPVGFAPATPAPTAAPTEAPAPVPTTKSAALPFAAIGGAGLAALAFLARRP